MLDFVFQVPIGCRQNARVGLQLLVRTDAMKTAILRHTQQFGLERRGHVGDFIKEDRSPIRHFEPAHALGNRSSEGAFFVPEQLAFQQRFRNRSAVDFDDRSGGARTPGVDHIGQHFFADPAFATDQDPAFRRGDQRSIVKNRLRERTGGDHAGRHHLVGAELHGRDFGHAGRLLHRREQLIEINRLGQIIERAIAHGADGVADICISRHQQDRQHRVLLARAAQGFQAGHARHSHVRDHHADFFVAQDFERALTRRHRQRIKSLAAQKRIQQAALAGVVIHDQDARGFGGIFAVLECHRLRNDFRPQ